MARLRLSDNVVYVTRLRRGLVERILSALPDRLFYAHAPLTGQDSVTIKVEPKRVEAYLVHDEHNNVIHVVATRRFRLIIDSGDTHVMVPSRLVEKTSVTLALFMGGLGREEQD